MSIKKDPVEETKEYLEAMKSIEPILDKEFPEGSIHMGDCHRYWHRKKQLLQKEGIEWKAPSEMNPDIIFD